MEWNDGNNRGGALACSWVSRNVGNIAGDLRIRRSPELSRQVSHTGRGGIHSAGDDLRVHYRYICSGRAYHYRAVVT